jgi:hypothetical protein
MASRWDSCGKADFDSSDHLDSTVAEIKERNDRLQAETLKLKNMLSAILNGLLEQEHGLDFIQSEIRKRRSRGEASEESDASHGSTEVRQQQQRLYTNTPSGNGSLEGSEQPAGDEELRTPVQADFSGQPESERHQHGVDDRNIEPQTRVSSRTMKESNGEPTSANIDWLLTTRSEHSLSPSNGMVSPSPQPKRASMARHNPDASHIPQHNNAKSNVTPLRETLAKHTKRPSESQSKTTAATKEKSTPASDSANIFSSVSSEEVPMDGSTGIVLRPTTNVPAPRTSSVETEKGMAKKQLPLTEQGHSTPKDPEKLLAFIENVEKTVAGQPVPSTPDVPKTPMSFQLDFLCRSLGCSTNLNYSMIPQDMQGDGQVFPCTTVIKYDPSHQVVPAIKGKHGTITTVDGQDGQGDLRTVCPLFWKNEKGWEYGGEYRAVKRIPIPLDVWEACSEDEKRSSAKKVAEAKWRHRLLIEQGLVLDESQAASLSQEQIMEFFRRVRRPENEEIDCC